MHQYNSTIRRPAFTLVELLVVVLIIGLLIGITVPLVGKMRDRAQAADTMAQINKLRAAIELYHQNFHAYPGPLKDEEYFVNFSGVPSGNVPTQVTPIGYSNTKRITASENLVLGLLGGLERDESNTNTQLRYNKDLIGQGPKNLSLGSNINKPYAPFIDSFREMLSDGAAWNAELNQVLANDTDIPEFVDRFKALPMPILYLRARPGAKGIMSDANTPGGGGIYQYDLRQIYSYTFDPNSAAALKLFGKDQGLWRLGDPISPTPEMKVFPTLANDALRYFSDQNVMPTNKSTPAGANATGTPRVKDTYILISAGIDRIYGTDDDITSFGDVVP